MADEKKGPFTPMAALYVLGGGLTISSVAGLFLWPDNPFFKIMLISVVAMAAALGVYRLVLMLKDKSKSGPFAQLLTKSSAGGAVDPATKARMDDLRRKFEEGVAVYKSAGKDLYTLPWFILVGPSGSGKTEALRRSNVGFPQGLQDCLQGAGGTLNMHWWFTNSAVVLDTAGRLFMQEDDREWKEFMRLLKLSRPNCPVNGLLLVISSENLLKDTAEKIESTAGAIARKLDEMQRILDVRFPVNVIVTKCDRIIGFKDFFETLNDPVLQHQILGWANPSSLDEAFKPSLVEEHLDTVRQKLLKRRMGLLQNPVHTSDASARRIDQIDEMFELPDNLVRIAPRLRLYLEKIFVAGEWSPKPLFLRGIYFTSSMREGQALDMSLAQALGVEVESLPGSRDWDKDKAYFLKDLFLERVFKERGLVTRATNVGKQLARQRMAVVGVIAAMLAISVGVGAVSFLGYQKSLGQPSSFWAKVPKLYESMDKKGGEEAPIPFIAVRDGAATYNGRAKIEGDGVDEEFTTPVAVIEQTTGMTKRIDIPAMAKPIAAFGNASGGFEDSQVAAHRAVVEVNVVRPLVTAARARLAKETTWDEGAVNALRELVRLQTYSMGATPSDTELQKEIESSGKSVKGKGATNRPVIDAEALFEYVLADDPDSLKEFRQDKDVIEAALARAYGGDYWAKNPPEQSWAVDEGLEARVRAMALALFDFKADAASPFGRLQALTASLIEYQAKEGALLGAAYVSDTGAGTAAGAANPRTIADYEKFDKEWKQRFDELSVQYAAVNEQVQALGEAAADPIKLSREEGDKLEAQGRRAFVVLLDQLPAKAEEGAKDKTAKAEPEQITQLRELIATNQGQVADKVKESRGKLDRDLVAGASLLVMGTEADQRRVPAYRARFETLRSAAEFVASAASLPESTEFVTIEDRLARVDKARDVAREKVSGHSSWKAEAGSLKALNIAEGAANAAAHDRAIRGSDKAVGLARARLVHEHLRQYIGASPKRTEEARARVTAIAQAGIDAKQMDRYSQPALPLSSFTEGEDFAAEYHPQGAARWLSNWDRVRMMLDSKASDPVLGAEQLTGESYRTAEDAVKGYVAAYSEYWRNQATERALPAKLPREWMAVKGAFPAVVSEVNLPLKRLRDILVGTGGGTSGGIGAMEAIPAELQKERSFVDAKKEIEKAFKGLSDDGFEGRARATHNAWNQLAQTPTASAAAERLLTAFRAGQAGAKTGCDQYYHVMVGERVLYWDDLASRCTAALANATSGDVGQALARLGGKRGSPLYLAAKSGGEVGAVVPLAELKPLEEDAKRVAQAAVARGGNEYDFSCVGTDLSAQLQAITGQGAIKDKATQDWARRVGELCVALSSSNVKIMFTGDVTFSTDRGENVWNRANYVRVVDKGQARAGIGAGKVGEDLLKERTTLVPNGSYEIQFYNEGNAGQQEIIATIPLNPAWPLLHEMLTSGEAVSEGEWGQAGWIEFPLKAGTNKVWLRMQVKTDKGVIGLDKWPAATEWP